jgi:1-acyl-sn-glycerol-3-phosphate acyltransferase
VSALDMNGPECVAWDPAVTEQVMDKARPLLQRYFRAEVRGLDALPRGGGALVVANHSGGSMTPDVLILGSAFYEKFGYVRPLFTLAHSLVFVGPLDDWLNRLGVVHASRENAAAALHSGAAVLVFPGGDYDAYRPTGRRNVIDFNGRTGYVRTAIETGVPIVPVVSIGGQETQLFLTRGTGLAKRLGLRRFRMGILPVTIGFPFGVCVFFPPNIPLPAKIVTQVLEPIDVAHEFGKDPDVKQVDTHVRSMMQQALDELATERRLPFIG